MKNSFRSIFTVVVCIALSQTQAVAGDIEMKFAADRTTLLRGIAPNVTITLRNATQHQLCTANKIVVRVLSPDGEMFIARWGSGERPYSGAAVSGFETELCLDAQAIRNVVYPVEALNLAAPWFWDERLWDSGTYRYELFLVEPFSDESIVQNDAASIESVVRVIAAAPPVTITVIEPKDEADLAVWERLQQLRTPSCPKKGWTPGCLKSRDFHSVAKWAMSEHPDSQYFPLVAGSVFDTLDRDALVAQCRTALRLHPSAPNRDTLKIELAIALEGISVRDRSLKHAQEARSILRELQENSKNPKVKAAAADLLTAVPADGGIRRTREND